MMILFSVRNLIL